jgi:hypothetical protein
VTYVRRGEKSFTPELAREFAEGRLQPQEQEEQGEQPERDKERPQLKRRRRRRCGLFRHEDAIRRRSQPQEEEEQQEKAQRDQEGPEFEGGRRRITRGNCRRVHADRRENSIPAAQAAIGREEDPVSAANGDGAFGSGALTLRAGGGGCGCTGSDGHGGESRANSFTLVLIEFSRNVSGKGFQLLNKRFA